MQHLQITYLCTSISVWDRCCSSAWHNFFWVGCSFYPLPRGYGADKHKRTVLLCSGTRALILLHMHFIYWQKKWPSIKSARSTKKPSTLIFVHRKKSFDILNQSANCAQCTHWSQLRCRSDAMMQKFKCQPRHKKKLQKVVLNVCTGQL